MTVLDGNSTNLNVVVDSLSIEPKLALDTESDPFHRYYEKVCLVQISTPERDLIFDPLVAGLPQNLAAIFADPQRTMVLHGADYDVRSLRRSFDLVMGKIFDTSIAAMFLGRKELGLKSLLESELQVIIDKGEQRSDWGRRPLTDEQLRYAATDTRHLLALAEHLSFQLEELDRLAWMEEECELLRKREPVEKVFDENGYRSLPGAKELAVGGRRALRALFLWREQEAKARDVPPFRVLPNDALSVLAAKVDKEGGALTDESVLRIKRIPKVDDVPVIARVIAEGISLEEPPEPVRRRDNGDKRVEREAAREVVDRLKKVRAARSAELRIDPGFLVSASFLERLARERPQTEAELSTVHGFTAWRVDAVGRDLLAALRI